jgi:DNA-binding beta-propeller fold protein YncE
MARTLCSIASAFLIITGVALLPDAGWAADPEPSLALEATIPLPDVSGRIDHMAVDAKRKRLIVAELGNNTVDVVDLARGKVVHRVTGLPEPQGVGYSERADLVAVASAGDGSVRLFRAEDLAPAGTVALGDDADNVRVDPRTGLVVVGFGGGGLALIDPASRAKVVDIRLPAHPEGFQIDPKTDRAFVNVPNAGQVAAVDLQARRIVGTWRMRLRGNFPMALDPASDLLAVVFRNPPVLALLDRDSGSVRGEARACGDADDVFFDGRRHRIYVSCGAGAVAVFQVGDGSLQPLPSVETAPGARTSLFVPTLDRLVVARRAGARGAAAILVYRPVP